MDGKSPNLFNTSDAFGNGVTDSSYLVLEENNWAQQCYSTKNDNFFKFVFLFLPQTVLRIAVLYNLR